MEIKYGIVKIEELIKAVSFMLVSNEVLHNIKIQSSKGGYRRISLEDITIGTNFVTASIGKNEKVHFNRKEYSTIFCMARKQNPIEEITQQQIIIKEKIEMIEKKSELNRSGKDSVFTQIEIEKIKRQVNKICKKYNFLYSIEINLTYVL